MLHSHTFTRLFFNRNHVEHFTDNKIRHCKRSSFAFGIFSIAMISAVGSSHADDLPKTEDVMTSGKLSILSSMAYAPFSYYEEGQKPAGLDIELAQAAADALGVRLDIVTTPFESIFPSIAAGRSKIAWSTFTATPERLKAVDFVTYLKSGIVLVVPTDKVANFQSQDKLCGAKIAVFKGNSSDFAVDSLSADCERSGAPKIEKFLYPTQQETIQAVLAGRVDGRLEDTTAASYYVNSTNKSMTIAPGEYFPLPLGAIIPKGDKKTAEMLQKVIQHLIDDGTYAKIFGKYNMSRAMIEHSEIITDANQLPQQ